MRSTIFCCLIAFLAAHPLEAQRTTDTLAIVPDRSASAAVTLGVLVPGAGHVYAGEYLRGVGFYFATVSLIGGGVLTYEINRCTFVFSSCDPGPTWPEHVLGIASIAAGAAAWTISAVDARRAVHRRLAKRRAGAVLGRVGAIEWRPVVTAFARTPGRVELGLSGTW